MVSAASPSLVCSSSRRKQGIDRLTYLSAAAAVFLSPYNVLRHPSVYFTASDVMTLLTFLVLLKGRRLPSAPFGALTPIWYAGFLAIALGLVIGGIPNRQLVAGSPVIAQYAYSMVILPWVLCRWDLVQTRRLLLVWVVSMIIVMLHGIYLVEFASDTPSDMVAGSGRLEGVLERENALAVLGAIAIVMTMYLSAEQALSHPVTLLFVSVLLYGIVLTASNTGVLAVTAGVIVFSLLQRSSRHYGTMALLCGLVFLAFLVGGDELLPKSFTRRVAGALTSGDLQQAGTFGDRMDLARAGWQASEKHILVGLGADGFRTTTNGPPVHNTYILMLVEGGIVSLAGLCLVIGTITLRGAVLWSTADTQNLGAMVIAFGLMVAVVLNTTPHVYGRFWFVPIILVLSLAAMGREPRATTRPPLRVG